MNESSNIRPDGQPLFKPITTAFSTQPCSWYNKCMYIIKEYIQYIKNNPNNYWFRTRWYGWGWVPATWQGWLSTAVYIILIIILGLYMDGNNQSRYSTSVFLLSLMFITFSFIILAYKKGEKTKWSWGPPSREDNN